MRPFIRTIETLELDGGALCLNFVNTVRHRFETPGYEFLKKPEDMIVWSARIGILDGKFKKILENKIQENRSEARNDLQTILKARELLYRIFRQLSLNRIPYNNDILEFNKSLSQTLKKLRIEITETLETKLIWNDEPARLTWILFPIVKSAYDVLVSDITDRVKECPNCGWLYLDKSKNNSRLWCNMKTCGNTVKIKKYYQKTKIMDNMNQSQQNM